MAQRLPRVTISQALRALTRDGWFEARSGGRHMILRHATKPGRVVLPRHPGQALPLGTLASILRDAGLTPDQFRSLL
ncbi:MAG TPA: type II toxin-antitoxin system HicA family toxin [Chloroflexota bacterium]|nr:type II toxin-antitoxin system HicA family toxin [Chloroflexota bacterium]